MKVKKVNSGVSSALKKKSLSFNREVNSIILQCLTEAVLEAKANHRFKARSGNLERSIMSDVSKDGNNIIGKLFLQDTIAEYALYIHRGFRSWAPDPFLREAKEKWFKMISEKINEKMRGI